MLCDNFSTHFSSFFSLPPASFIQAHLSCYAHSSTLPILYHSFPHLRFTLMPPFLTLITPPRALISLYHVFKPNISPSTRIYPPPSSPSHVYASFFTFIAPFFLVSHLLYALIKVYSSASITFMLPLPPASHLCIPFACSLFLLYSNFPFFFFLGGP